MKIQEFRLKIYVRDFETMKNFYELTLGFSIKHSWDHSPNNKGIMFDTGAGIIELLVAGENYVPTRGCDVSLQVQEVKLLWNNLKNHCTIIHGLRNNPWGDHSFCIADPEGFRITFFSPV
jgi:predicted enzyme related to lactoylglutathione lyase